MYHYLEQYRGPMQGRDDLDLQITDRLDRADRTGTTSRLGEGNFNDPYLLVLNGGRSRGCLPRGKLAAYLRSNPADPDNLDDSLLEPLEDDDDDDND
jgi:hypothetical protein